MQTDIISGLSSELSQGGVITEKDINEMNDAARERQALKDMLF